MKLFCDEMLLRLGRWLRAAGYDTAIAENAVADAEIIERCAGEGRTLITRDRHLEARAQGRVSVIRLAEEQIEAQARIAPRARHRLAAGAVCPLSYRQCAAQAGAARNGHTGAACLARRWRPAAALPGMRSALLDWRPCPTDAEPAHAVCKRMIPWVDGVM